MPFDRCLDTELPSRHLPASAPDASSTTVSRPLLVIALAAIGTLAFVAWPQGLRIASVVLKVAWLYLVTGARG